MKTRVCECLFAMGRFLLPSSGRIRLLISLLVLVDSVGLTGCGPRRVRADFTHYENSYAVTSNHEELLNLARLEQHDPTYFFKLGQISSSYRMEASLTGAGNLTPVSNPGATAIPTGGGTPGLIYENDPSFTMIPVNDDTNAQILLRPVDATVFYSLYLQGWRLDQLFRLTVSRIELAVPTAQGCQVEVIRNLPPSWYDAANSYQNDAFSLASYTEFLRVSAVIFALQKHGLLLLHGTSAFQPLDSASYLPNQPSPQGPPDQSSFPDDQSKTAKSTTPGASDFNTAAEKNHVWELQGANKNGQGGNWFLGANSIEPQFQLTYRTAQSDDDGGWASECKKNPAPGSPSVCEYGKNVKTIEDVLKSDFALQGNGMKELLMPNGQLGPDVREILEILYNGFSIEESSADQLAENKLCSGAIHDRISAHLVMRSLIGLMAAAAEEQQSFEKLEATNPVVPNELGQVVMQTYNAAHLATTGQPPNDTENAEKMALLKVAQGAHINQAIPQIEQLPVLKLTWTDSELRKAQNSEAELERLGLALYYKSSQNDNSDNELYLITDLRLQDTPIPQNVYWNRDMFRLINELSSQVSVDISKFPLPEVLQLRTE